MAGGQLNYFVTMNYTVEAGYLCIGVFLSPDQGTKFLAMDKFKLSYSALETENMFVFSSKTHFRCVVRAYLWSLISSLAHPTSCNLPGELQPRYGPRQAQKRWSTWSATICKFGRDCSSVVKHVYMVINSWHL